MDPGEGLKRDLERMLHDIREGRPPKRTPRMLAHLDADELATFLGAALHQAGYKTRLKVVKQRGMSEFHHVFLEVWHPGAQQWIPVDPQRTTPEDWEEEAVVGI